MEKKNLNLTPMQINQMEGAEITSSQVHMNDGEQATMDVTASLRKISKELLELEPDQHDLFKRIKAASWLIHYIADCLDVELMHAAERGRKLASRMNGNVEVRDDVPTNQDGQRMFPVIRGEDL